MSLWKVALISLLFVSSSAAQEMKSPSAGFFKKGPATNFDVFKEVPAQFPNSLDDGVGGKKRSSTNAMVPTVLDNMIPADLNGLFGPSRKPPTTTEAPIPSSLLTAASTSVVVMNASKGSMFFLPVDIDGATEFEIVATKIKTLVLSGGRKTLALSYSIEGQRKQIVLSAGHGYMLDVDGPKREIVARVTIVGTAQ